MTGTKLKALRIKRGLSQSALATMSEVSQKTISRIENGKTGILMLRGDAIKRISQALDIPPESTMFSNNGKFSCSESEKDLIKYVRMLPENKKIRIRHFVEFELVTQD